MAWTTGKGMWKTALLAAAVAAGTPAAARAQSAIIYGSLSNFDISNDTGQVCHGFEIDLDGLAVSDYGGSFAANRYGTPTVAATPTGIAVTYKSAFNAATQSWSERTLQHTVPWFSGQCYQWVPNTYQNGGCEHFGTYYMNANPTKITARWLCENPADPSALVAVNPPTAVPYPYYSVQAPAAPNNPPQLVVEVEAPEPAEAPELYGDAQWMRVYKVELQRELSLDELVADNIVIPGDLAQLESDYQVIQQEPAAGGNGNRRRKRNQGNIAPTTRSVVRRIELWDFTGQYDPVTHEALCADLLCNAPAANEIGQLISVQMTAANVQPDAVIVTKVGSGNIDSSDKLIACGNKCAQPYNAGTVVTLTAKAASNNTFSGWSGACAGFGTQTTCTVSANGAVNVGATFAAVANGGGGGGGGVGGGGGGGNGGGGGGGAAQFTLQIGRSNPGTVTGAPAGDKTIDCGSTCSAKFNAGTAVTLTATPPAGKAFVSWGGACSGTAAACTVTLDANKSVQANFSK